MPSFATVFTSLIAISASALAFTTPTTFNVTTNPVFTPNEGDIVPVGKPYQITWGPTESGTVSIILLRGPSSNAVPLYPIIEKIKNTGKYTWTPKADLEADKTHYGLQIIIDANGQYQYSTQFGISNPDYKPPKSSSSKSGYEPTFTSYSTVSHTTKSYITSLITVTTPVPHYNTTSAYTPTYAPPSQNTTITYVSSPTPEPTTEPSSTKAPVPSQTGAASSVKVASGLLVGVAAVAAILF